MHGPKQTPVFQRARHSATPGTAGLYGDDDLPGGLVANGGLGVTCAGGTGVAIGGGDNIGAGVTGGGGGDGSGAAATVATGVGDGVDGGVTVAFV